MLALKVRPVLMCVLFLLAAVVVPTRAGAEDGVREVTINGAVVRIQVKDGKTYVAVKSGTLTLRYSDGRIMAKISAKAALMLRNLKGSLDVTENGLKMTGRQPKRMTVALSSESKRVKFYSDSRPSKRRYLEPGQQTKIYAAKYRGRYYSRRKFVKIFRRYLTETEIADDRTLLSLSN